jgi:hypothetical protein
MNLTYNSVFWLLSIILFCKSPKYNPKNMFNYKSSPVLQSCEVDFGFPPNSSQFLAFNLVSYP